MNLNLHILKATGRLNPYLTEIEGIYSQAENKIIGMIPVDNVDIVVADNPFGSIPEIGIGGYTRSPNYIEISLDPGFSNFHDTLQKELLDTLAHEFHHASRWQSIGYGKTLLESMVSEGLADHFAIEITGRKDIHLWDKALHKKERKLQAEKAIKEYNNKNYSHTAWFFGSKEKGIPRWTAYTLGFQMVSNYIKTHPDAKASTLYNIEAKEFV